MKGCPEGGEQSFLFSLYSQLSADSAPCPHDCGATISRAKGDFFALHVSQLLCASFLQALIHVSDNDLGQFLNIHRPSAKSGDKDMSQVPLENVPSLWRAGFG